jgi:hypothetical protein
VCRTDQTFCLIFLPRTTGACTRAGKCAGPIRCLSDVDGLFQQRQDCGLRCTSHAFVTSANSVIETPNYRFDHRRAIAIGTAARESKPGLTDSPISIRKVATVTSHARRNFPPKWLIRSAMDVLSLHCPPQSESMEKRKKILRLKETGDSGKAFLGWYTAPSRYRARSAKDREAIGRATANKTLWRQKTTCKKSYQSMSMRRQRFNIESLRHKKVCDKGKRGKEGISAWHIIQTPFPRRKHFPLCRRIA